MKSYRRLVIVTILGGLLTACAASKPEIKVSNQQSEPVKVLYATGYSRFNNEADLAANQRWYQAQQMAKLAADRDLAAQIYQEPLANEKTVAAQIMVNEAYRIYVDNYLRTAQASDYHTVQDVLQVKMALTLTDNFYRCLASDVAGINQCLQAEHKSAFTRIGFKPAQLATANIDCSALACADQYVAQGFSRKSNALDDALLASGGYDSQWATHTTLDLMARLLLIQGFIHGF